MILEVAIVIKIVKGDLLHATENFICHQVNCQGKMGSGVALQVRQKYPHVYEFYQELVAEQLITNVDGQLLFDYRHELLGKVHSVEIGNKQWILNLFGQNNYGYDGKMYTDTEALFKCFKQVRVKAEKLGLTVAMPYMIGSFRGGADWRIVEDLLLTAFDGYEVTLYKKHEG
jgi:O-acetyl-ADP-ribose deacetylase (regulator of RNase III)